MILPGSRYLHPCAHMMAVDQRSELTGERHLCFFVVERVCFERERKRERVRSFRERSFQEQERARESE